MAVATINLDFDDDMIRQIDYFANNDSLSRTDLIYNSVKMYISRKQRLQELYVYGESIAARNTFTEDERDNFHNYARERMSFPEGS
jgi:metal-responsive CopG/Arc/MetJ family transcriptional regulator